MLFNISIIWVVFAFLFLYNVILIEKSLVTGRNLLLFSLAFAIIGFVVAAALVFYLKNAFHKYPLWLSVVLKMVITFFIFIIVAFIILAFYYVFGSKQKLNDYATGFYENVFLTRAFLIFIIDLAVMTLMTILILEITDKYGPGGFWSIIGENIISQRSRTEFLYSLILMMPQPLQRSWVIKNIFNCCVIFLQISQFPSWQTVAKFINTWEMKWYCPGKILH